jgi:hypothetical protein
LRHVKVDPLGTAHCAIGLPVDELAQRTPNGRRFVMTQLPHVLKRIRLNLARSKQFPLGSDKHEEEAGYRFGNHIFRPGECVSIRGEDGEMHTFQVVSVEAAT